MGRQITYHADIPMDGGMIQVRLERSLLERCHSWHEELHKTSDYELHILIKGGCAMYVGEEALFLRQGEAILIAPEVPHASDSGDGSSIRRFHVRFSVEGEKLRRHLRQEVGVRRVIRAGQEIAGLADEIMKEIAVDRPVQTECVWHMMGLLFFRLFHVAGFQSGTAKAHGADNELERRGIIDDFFRYDLEQKKSEEELAQLLGMSVRQMIRVLKKNYGMTYREMLIQKRMERAAYLLRSTNDTVGTIAEAVGYGSETAFTQAFRTVYGTTPGRYRKR